MSVAAPTGLRITRIHNAKEGATNENEEWVSIVNEGIQTWDVRGWLLTDETSRQLLPHIYQFPDRLANGHNWSFAPGEIIFVFTGTGNDVFISRPSAGQPQFQLHWGRNAMVWNNTGDRVYLRNRDGTFVTQPYPIP